MRLKKLAKIAVALFVGVPVILSLPVALFGLLQGSLRSSVLVASWLSLLGGGAFTALRWDARTDPDDIEAVATDGGDDDATPTPKEYIYSRSVRTDRFWKAEVGLYSVGGILFSVVYFVL